MRELIRYVICPGPIRSQTDGDTHYVGADALMRLYGVRPWECTIYPENDRGWRRPPFSVYLEPQYDGNYSLPTYHGPLPAWKPPLYLTALRAKIYSALPFLNLLQ